MLVSHKKPTPSLPAKEDSDSDAATEPPPGPPGQRDRKPAAVTTKEPLAQHKKPAPSPLSKEEPADINHSQESSHRTPGKKPAAPQKPSLPPKKPLPVKTKKPDITVKKPEKKVDPEKSAAVKKSAEDTREHADSKQAGSLPVKEKDEEISKPADKKPAVEIKTEDVGEGTHSKFPLSTVGLFVSPHKCRPGQFLYTC